MSTSPPTPPTASSPALRDALLDLLAGVERPGDFCVAGRLETPIPHLEIDGIGPIAFPLLPWQAEQIRASSEQAPYGRGAKTLVDTAVRRTWQVGVDHLRLADPRWSTTLAEIAQRAAAGLGVPGEVRADLYKLLLYEVGSFFVEHRDSEKVDGMFATLVVVLPSLYEGGELVVRHRGREEVLPLKADGVSQVSYAAFYADCLHELRPVQSGYRLALIYNLAVVARPPPSAPDYGPELERATRLLQSWGGELSGPDKLVVVLDHHYTSAGLSWSILKNQDAARAGLLLEAAARSGCLVHLAMVSIREAGSAESNHDFYRARHRDRRDEVEDFEVIEVTDRTEEVGEWRDAEDTPVGLTALPLLDDELCPPDALEQESPDEQHYQEATGNEGASFERTWRRAAIVLWPAHRTRAVVDRGGFPAQLSLLVVLATRWARSGADRTAPEWTEAHALSTHLIANWPQTRWVHPLSRRGAELLGALIQLRAGDEIERFVRDVIVVGEYDGSENTALIETAGVLGWSRTAPLLAGVVRATALFHLSAVTALVARALAAARDVHEAGLVQVVTALVEALPGDPARVQGLPSWPRPPDPDAETAVLLLNVLAALGDEPLAARAVSHLLRWPGVWPVDGVLLPALTRLWPDPSARPRPGVAAMRAALVQHLEARVALPLEAPRDWRRPATTSCSCEDCRDLRVFLASPTEPSWRLRAHKDNRTHVEEVIRRHKLDLDCQTERRGSPHTLVCTKNNQSYERRVRQRQEDLQALGALGARG